MSLYQYLSSADQESDRNPLVSVPAERGTAKAALVDAIWAEDIHACRSLLDAEPELVSATLRQWAHLKTIDVGMIGSPFCIYDTLDDYFEHLPPIVFACLLPRWKQAGSEDRTPNLPLIRFFGERSTGLGDWQDRILAEICWLYDSPEVLEILVSLGAEMLRGGGNYCGTGTYSLVQMTAGKGRIGAVRFLLDRGVTLARDPDTDDGTPLNSAARSARYPVVELLLQRGAVETLEATDSTGLTPLGNAVNMSFRDKWDERSSMGLEEREKVIRILIEAGARLVDLPHGEYFPGPQGRYSILRPLATWGSPDIIRFAVQRGCDVHERMACHHSMQEDVQEEDSPIEDIATALHGAADVAYMDGVRTLVELGADVNAMDDYKQTPLHWTVLRINDWDTKQAAESWEARLAAAEATMDHLLLHGAKINHQDKFGRTPLHYMTGLSISRIIIFLVSRGADLDLVDAKGRSVFHAFATTPQPMDWWTEPESNLEALHASLKQALSSQGISILNHLSNNGETALHIACGSLHVPAVRLLLRLGADPNTRDKSGSTALHRAMQISHAVKSSNYSPQDCGTWLRWLGRVRAHLLEAGADAGLVDARGEPPRDEAALKKEVASRRGKWLMEEDERMRLEEVRRNENNTGMGPGQGWGVSGMGRGMGRGRPS